MDGIPPELHGNWMLGRNIWFDGRVSFPACEAPIDALKLLNLILISLPKLEDSVASPGFRTKNLFGSFGIMSNY